MILAAGEGTRLRPLTGRLPKALCPVGNIALLERALRRLAGLGLAGPDRVAVNACYLGDQVVAQVGARATVSVEPTLLGTAGALGRLREWIAGRGVLVGNADAYLADSRRAPGPDIAALLHGWDGRTVRLLGQPAPDPQEPGTFTGTASPASRCCPGSGSATLPAEPADLVRTVWRPAEAAGECEVVPYPGIFFDTGTPADYLSANLHAAGADEPDRRGCRRDRPGATVGYRRGGDRYGAGHRLGRLAGRPGGGRRAAERDDPGRRDADGGGCAPP